MALEVEVACRIEEVAVVEEVVVAPLLVLWLRCLWMISSSFPSVLVLVLILLHSMPTP